MKIKKVFRKFLATIVVSLVILMTITPFDAYCMTIQGTDKYGVSNSYMTLPLNVQTKFDASDWQVYVLPCDEINALYGAPAGCNVGGFTDYNTHEIYINGMRKYNQCIYHEIGHWVDAYYWNKNGYAYVSSTPEFMAIYAEEGKNFTAYGGVDSSEFFAEIFKAIQTGNTLASKVCPKAVAYVQTVTATF